MYTSTTEESNNVPVAPGSSSDSKVAEPLKVEGGAKYNFQVMEHDHILAATESMNEAKAKVDHMELLAQNRGNAMLRYKEKKKLRRYKINLFTRFFFFFE